MLRWCRIVANQPTLCTTVSGSHAPRRRSAATKRTRLATTHLFRAGIAQELLDRGRLVAARRHEDAEVVVGEPRIVLNRPEATRGEGGVEQDAEYGRQCAEQNGHLEHDDDVGR